MVEQNFGCWRWMTKQILRGVNVLKNKSNGPNRIIGLIKHLKAKYKFVVVFLCCDNAGENQQINYAIM